MDQQDSKHGQLARAANKDSSYDGEGKKFQSWGAGRSHAFAFSRKSREALAYYNLFKKKEEMNLGIKCEIVSID
jgi:hypothetical protein